MRLVLAVAVLVSTAGAVVALARGAGVAEDVFAVPPAGEAVPVLLADATPAFVVAPALGEVVVVEARTPEQRTVGTLVGWCPAVQAFVEPHHGAVFHADGRRSAIVAPAFRGPAALPGRFDLPADLTRREVVALGSNGRTLRVGERLPPAEAAALDRVGPSPPAGCAGSAPQLLGPAPPTPPASELVTHAAMATPLAALTDGVRLLEGVAVRDETGARLCGEPCSEPAPLPWPGTGVAGVETVLEGPLLVTVEGGEVSEVVALPDTAWRGAGFEPLEVFDATLRNLSVTAGFVDLQLPGRDGSRGPIEVPRDLRCSVTVTGRLVLMLEVPQDDLARLETLRAGQPVEVVADASSCRALRVVGR